MPLPFAEIESPIGETCRCRRDRRAPPASRSSRDWEIARGRDVALRGHRATARSHDRQNRRTGSTRRIPAPGTASECPASAINKRSSREAGQGSSTRDSVLRCRNWRSGRGSAERRQSIPPGDRGLACRALFAATGSAAPDRGSRVWRQQRTRAGDRDNPSSRPRDVRSAPPWRCDGSRRSTMRRARIRPARPGAPAGRVVARSQRRQR